MRRSLILLTAWLLAVTTPTAHAQSSVSIPDPAFGGGFTLHNSANAPVTLHDFQGKNLVLTFGASPPALARLAQALALADPSGAKIRAALITTAPAQPPPRVTLLSGPAPAVRRAAAEYNATNPALAAKLFYLVGPNGKFIALIPASLTPGQMAGQLKRLSR
ncbi:hypothetical protein [Acidocella sp.]|uniref:hypothetical protein n=1 Tax=Acidocella sp. TaxID=50710 RepID=UPI002618C0EE|nr:hypothetical protein [Acidocella sp.]